MIDAPLFGQRVSHDRYGTGTVISRGAYELNGKLVVMVRFDNTKAHPVYIATLKSAK